MAVMGRFALNSPGGAATTTTTPLVPRPLAPRNRRRSLATSSACQYGNPTFWIGVSMFCLVIVYVLIVVAVTRIHFTTSNSGATTTSVGLPGTMERTTTHGQQQPPFRSNQQNASSSNIMTLRDRLQRAKEEREKQQQGAGDNKNVEPAAKKNPLRQFHLENPLDHGVVPEVLLPSGSADTGNKELVAVSADKLAAAARAKANRAAFHNVTREIVLKAYLEPPNFEEWDVKPLPVRAKAKAEQLQVRTYPKLNSCSRLLEQWPVDDDTPTNEDPFLPWIHDVFPTHDGKFIQFVAQNKRRCKTGRNEQDILKAMQPQAALFQHVPIQRVKVKRDNATRYKLVPYEQADPDGITTRFICRFKPTMQETLSVHNFDYDWTSYRKRYKNSFSPDDGGIKSIHTTQLIFRCPVPENLQETVRTGASVKDDWATLFVDLVTIRTPPRWGAPHQYLAPKYAEFRSFHEKFDPKEAWGNKHILPRLEDSGRWENIPICLPSLLQYEGQEAKEVFATRDEKPQKKHKLVSCIWASAGYTTRGNRFAVNDGQRRLLEWISHNRNIGFDHFYIYDNTGAFRDDISLEPIANLFPGEITYMRWPAQICNNNPNNVDSPGERSSQYAAEASCRLRFGPHTEWIGQFDVDEYLIPMGKHNSALSLLGKLDKEDTRIISFGSWRAWPRWALIDKIQPINDPEICWSKAPCFDLRIPMNTTMLQAYNCDRQLPGQKTSTMPAEKQIYRADYVVQHFIHYSAATVLSEMNREEYEKEGFRWSSRGFPDARQRFADEVNEGLMIHSKAVAHQDTIDWERVCHINAQSLPYKKRGLCRLGVPWPKDHDFKTQNATKDGWAFNCYVNEKVENYYVPKLEKSMKERLHFFDAPK